MTWDEN